MADLTRAWTWERWVPPLGDNPGDKPFYLEVACGLTKEQLRTFIADHEKSLQPPDAIEGQDVQARWRAFADQIAAVLGKYVRLGTEPLRLLNEDQSVAFEVKNISDFCLLSLQGPKMLVWEAARAVGSFNSVAGQLEVFSARHSGGTGTTPGPSVVKDRGQMGGR